MGVTEGDSSIVVDVILGNCFAISIIPCLMVYYIASVLFLLGGDAQKV